MRGYLAFFKKEWMEAIRTYRLFLLLTVFLLLGIMNPVTAKLLPVILENFMPEGMDISIQTAGAMDSWQQFYKNVPQMGLIVVVIMFSGMLAGEFGKGTLVPMLAKGLRRDAVIFAKYTMSAFLWTMAYVLCAAVSFLYTVYFWPKDHVGHIISSLFMVWLFGMLLLAIMIFFGAVTKHMAGVLLGTGGIVVIMFIINLIPDLASYNPISLCTENMSLLQGLKEPVEYRAAMLISIGLIILSLFGACRVFRKQSV